MTTAKIEELILSIRGQRVMVDADLAALYGVTTKVLNQAVKRNKKRFPDGFLFQLTKEEKLEVVTNCDHLKKVKYSNRLPYVFTEHGTLMAATVLNSDKATEMSVYVIRAFIKMREFFLEHKDLAKRLARVENKLSAHDKDIRLLVGTVKQLMQPPSKPKRKIGF